MRMRQFAAAAVLGLTAACGGSAPTAPKAETETADQFAQNVYQQFNTAGCTKDNKVLELEFYIHPSLTDAKRLNKPLPFSTADAATVQTQTDSLAARIGRETVAADFPGNGGDHANADKSLEKNLVTFKQAVEAQTGGLSVELGAAGYKVPTQSCTAAHAARSANVSIHRIR